jgi:hypothetical protein
MSNEYELKNELMYIHVGIGSPGFRSYSLGLCKTFTSTCLRNHMLRKFYRVYTASHVNYVFKKFLSALDVLQKPFHTYKSNDRTYYVYKYEYNLMLLIEHIFNLAELIHKNRTLRDKKSEIVNGILQKCSDISTCLDVIVKTIIELKEEIEKRKKSGKKALLTRFTRNTQKCKHIIDKYFSDLESAPTFKVSEIGFAECSEDAVKILKKLFPEDIARRYANSICSGGNSIYLFARDSIIAIDARYENKDIKIYYDSCRDTPSYTIVKLVGASLVNGYIDRIDWIAVLGYDKATNQVFLHYVPRTLIFKDVEACRKWILGLTDRYGNPFEDVELIEV